MVPLADVVVVLVCGVHVLMSCVSCIDGLELLAVSEQLLPQEA